MAPRALPLALGLLATALLSCGGSGLDVETPLVFQGDPAGAFGTTVAQFGTSDDGWVLVGAPLERGGADETGAVYRCRFQSGRCQKVPVAGPPGAVNASLGLALAAGDGGVLACGPTSPQACGVNVHLNGFCVHLDSALQPLRRLPDAFPECPKSSMDIAFLIDGSGSIAPHEFNAMKTFIVEVMKRFQGADVQFSLTQFSSRLHDHFDFSTFRDHPDPALLLRSVQQLRGPTHTATAILHVLQRMFLPDRGARAGARRILIVVTDGEKYGDNLSYSDVIPLAESMAVTRYAIGVGSAFLKPNAQAELHEIASSPAHDHVFRVDNFGALGDIQNQLQEKIFAIEGTQSAHSSSFQLEMAQEGFSALVTPEGPVLGAVGAYDWSGGVFVYGGGGAPTFVNVSRDLGNLGDLGDLRDMDDAYLGYSVASLALGGSRGLALGAPRFRHLGRVLVFAPGTTWKLLAEATGPQVGSYFGAALLPLQPRPGAAPALLVGAPQFYGGGGGGRVDVCEVSGKSRHLRCRQTLRGHPGHPLGRFGASLAHLGDLDGDGWPEVAVGAPLEDEGRGAVYLFRGTRGGISARDGQRIPGSAFPSRPRFFGQALSGGRDLSGDRLPDVAVGAQGQVLLLRSQPLLKVTVAVTFEPRVVPASAFECPEGEELRGPLATARICFVGAKKTPDSFGSQISASLWFRAELD
ncbi:integrin alpha-D-like, partial [Aphelocoma coerulescens]|uniref:integrin alpha-D-like n=1 Tax=Aphelocoma coerulescens TaxID=39617 RepID=UPI0036044D12